MWVLISAVCHLQLRGRQDGWSCLALGVEKRECFLTCSIALGASLVGVPTSEYILRALLGTNAILSLPYLPPPPPDMFSSATLKDKPTEDLSLC